MTVLRSSTLTALVLAGAAIVAGAIASACTSGTTPTCDDAGSCLILANPIDGAIGSQEQPDAGDEGDAPAE
jgi:hypothetical protein